MKRARRLPDETIEMIAARFRALGEPQRIKLVQLLEEGPKTVSDLVEALETSQPNVSRHLQTLFEARLVARRRTGNSVVYSIADPFVMELCALVCQNAQSELKRQLAYMDALPRLRSGKAAAAAKRKG